MKRQLLQAGAPLAFLVAGAACGGAAPAANPPTTGGAAAAVTVAGSPLGQLLVDGSGRTVYLFEADKTDASTCFDACAVVWPPVTTTGQPHAAAGATAALGTISRRDGKTQVTYNGHPLYYYVSDTKAGDTTGQGLNQFGAAWYVLSPAGNKIDNS